MMGMLGGGGGNQNMQQMMQQMMSNPMMQQMMDQVMSNPEYLRSMLGSNPMVREVRMNAGALMQPQRRPREHLEKGNSCSLPAHQQAGWIKAGRLCMAACCHHHEAHKHPRMHGSLPSTSPTTTAPTHSTN